MNVLQRITANRVIRQMQRHYRRNYIHPSYASVNFFHHSAFTVFRYHTAYDSNAIHHRSAITTNRGIPANRLAVQETFFGVTAGFFGVNLLKFSIEER